MDEGNVGLLERNREGRQPIAKDAEDVIDIREEFRKMEYSEAVRKLYGSALPQTQGELRVELDKKAKELVEKREDAEREFRSKVPDKVLKDEESIWQELGWDREKRARAIRKLSDLLLITESRAENTLEILIASGKTFEDVDRNLTMDTYSSFIAELMRESQQDKDNNRLISTMREYQGQVGRDGAGKLLFLQEKLGLENTETNKRNDEYLVRFVLDDYFREKLDREFDTELPQNLYDLAWNITYHGQKEWGLQGDFPVLQMQVRKNEQTGEYEGRYVVNQANFLRWLRERMFYRYDAFETDEVPNYYSVVTIDKGAYATVSLATMIFDKSRYFRDETGVDWDDLYNAVFIEPFDLIFDRTYAIEHQKVYDSNEEFQKAWEGWARLSKFTRKINGQSMVDRAMMLPLDLVGKDSDTKVGEALLTMFLGYYNLADIENLKNVLGADSKFFTRQGWIDAALDFESGGTAGTGGMASTGLPSIGEYFGDSQKYFDKAFDEKTGKITSVDDFLLFINPNWHEYPPQNVEKVLAQSLQNAVADKFKSSQGGKKEAFDKYSLQIAWLKAYSWIGFTGARARNNFKPTGEPSGHHQETRLLMTDAYRMKYETFGGAGNLYTVPMFKQLSIPFFEGTLSENGKTEYWAYEKGNLVKKKRNKTQMEVMLEMRQGDLEWERRKKELEKKYGIEKGKIPGVSADEEEARLEKFSIEMKPIDDYYKNIHKLHAAQLEFNDNAMLVFAKNMIGMANPLYDRVMKAKETSFEKFTSYDGIFSGPSFHREEWQDALQSKLFTPLRYIFEANGGTQLNQRVRAPVYMGRDAEGHDRWEWREQYLGERMIGHQVLDIPTFWEKAEDLPAEVWEAKKKAGYRKRRGYIIRPDGKHEINYNKVHDNKKMVYKQWMLMKLAADLWSHIDMHSSDPRYSLEHYEDIVDAIKNLPGDFFGDEYDMQGARNTKSLFSKHQIEWLERISGKDRLFVKSFISDIFIGDKKKKESLFGESSGIIISAIFKGYG